jgi:flavin-dependent dehydrogenase
MYRHFVTKPLKATASNARQLVRLRLLRLAECGKAYAMVADVLIVGGGPAGTAAALTLLRYSRLSVILIEHDDYVVPRVGETVGSGVTPLLKYLGVWDHFLRDNHRPAYASAAAWGSEQVITQDFLFNGYGDGWHLDRNKFDRMLATAVNEHGGVVLRNHSFNSIKGDDRAGWRVVATVQNGDRIDVETSFVVDATGRSAVLARLLGQRQTMFDSLIGITALTDSPSSKSNEHFTLIEACADGWWYSARVRDDRMVVAFITDADIARTLKACRTQGWNKLFSMTQHTYSRAQHAQCQRLIVRAAGSQRLNRAGGEGWIAVGDAAASFDPIAGMGIGHALASGANGARAIHKLLVGRECELLEAYISDISNNFEAFLRIRHSLYSREARWPEHPFWQRRHRNS